MLRCALTVAVAHTAYILRLCYAGLIHMANRLIVFLAVASAVAMAMADAPSANVQTRRVCRSFSGALILYAFRDMDA